MSAVAVWEEYRYERKQNKNICKSPDKQALAKHAAQPEYEIIKHRGDKDCLYWMEHVQQQMPVNTAAVVAYIYKHWSESDNRGNENQEDEYARYTLDGTVVAPPQPCDTPAQTRRMQQELLPMSESLKHNIITPIWLLMLKKQTTGLFLIDISLSLQVKPASNSHVYHLHNNPYLYFL